MAFHKKDRISPTYYVGGNAYIGDWGKIWTGKIIFMMSLSMQVNKKEKKVGLIIHHTSS